MLALALVVALVAPVRGFAPGVAPLRGSWNSAGRCSTAPRFAVLGRRGGALQLAASGGDAGKSEAEQEASKWAEMAAKMEAQRASAPEGDASIGKTGGKASMGMEDLQGVEGQKIGAPGRGELDVLQARAEAFKKKQQAQEVDLPKRWQGPASAGQKAPQRLVGGDAGSMRQAAPYVPGDSKAGASQEGWTEDQLEKILDEERKWKEQVAAKEAEADAANQLAKKGDRFKVGSKMRVEKGVPSTMESSVVQALVASLSVMKRGCGRFRIDVDTTAGDETYTTLKNSIPFTRVYARALSVNGFDRVRIVLGDAGAAALAVRDWAGGDGHRVSSFERSGLPQIDEDDDVAIIVAPAASEIETLRKLCERCAEIGVPVILINPSVKSPGGENLGSLGLFSLQLSDFLSSFEYAYYLRTLPWGLILRTAPGPYEVYQNGMRPGVFDLISSAGSLPVGEVLEDIYLEANPGDAKDGLEGVAQKFGRFVSAYTKG